MLTEEIVEVGDDVFAELPGRKVSVTMFACEYRGRCKEVVRNPDGDIVIHLSDVIQQKGPRNDPVPEIFVMSSDSVCEQNERSHAVTISMPPFQEVQFFVPR